MASRYRVPPARRTQQGAVLAIALILLVVMTLLAVAALRGTLLESRMAAGQRDRSIAFQSAEAGLRVAEELIKEDATGSLGQNCVGTNTVGCGMPTDAGEVAGVAWIDAADAQVSATAVGKPQYIIQRFDSLSTAEAYGLGNSAGTGNAGGEVATFTARGFYRVYSRSHDPATNDERALVVLSANYAIPLPGSS